jgi:hypothetical protein
MSYSAEKLEKPTKGMSAILWKLSTKMEPSSLNLVKSKKSHYSAICKEEVDELGIQEESLTLIDDGSYGG